MWVYKGCHCNDTVPRREAMREEAIDPCKNDSKKLKVNVATLERSLSERVVACVL